MTECEREREGERDRKSLPVVHAARRLREARSITATSASMLASRGFSLPTVLCQQGKTTRCAIAEADVVGVSEVVRCVSVCVCVCEAVEVESGVVAVVVEGGQRGLRAMCCGQQGSAVDCC